MDKTEAIWRAIAALRDRGEKKAANVLEDSLKITGNCQYCGNQLEGGFEMITLQDTCEHCWIIEGIHPALVRQKLIQAMKLLQEDS